jgi:hypothetical protein
MNIKPHDLGIVSGDEESKIKFILLENGTLLYGKCEWHKDLAMAAKVGENAKVIGAGVVPENIAEASIEDNVWGEWKSTGYGVVTSLALRKDIQKALMEASKVS